MSSSLVTASPAREGAPSAATVSTPWYRNPSYPRRIHFSEQAGLEARLKACDERIAPIRKKISLLGNDPRRSLYDRLYQQMMGVRDQIADAVNRMPREAGHTYHEDHERIDAAERALTFLLQRWETAR